LARQTDTGSVLDAGRYVDRERALARDAARAGAAGARIVDHLTAALAGHAGPLQREEALLVAHLPLPAAGRAGLRLRAGLGALPERGMAEAVVGGALLLVLQDLVGFADFLELVLAILVAGILVRVPPHRELAIGDLQLRVGRGARHFQDFVIVALRHPAFAPK